MIQRCEKKTPEPASFTPGLAYQASCENFDGQEVLHQVVGVVCLHPFSKDQVRSQSRQIRRDQSTQSLPLSLAIRLAGPGHQRPVRRLETALLLCVGLAHGSLPNYTNELAHRLAYLRVNC